MNKTQVIFNKNKMTKKSMLYTRKTKSQIGDESKEHLEKMTRIVQSQPSSPQTRIRLDLLKSTKKENKRKVKNKVKFIKFDKQLGNSFYVEKYKYNFKNTKPLTSNANFSRKLDDCLKIGWDGKKSSTAPFSLQPHKRLNNTSQLKNRYFLPDSPQLREGNSSLATQNK